MDYKVDITHQLYFTENKVLLFDFTIQIAIKYQAPAVGLANAKGMISIPKQPRCEKEYNPKQHCEIKGGSQEMATMILYQ